MKYLSMLALCLMVTSCGSDNTISANPAGAVLPQAGVPTGQPTVQAFGQQQAVANPGTVQVYNESQFRKVRVIVSCLSRGDINLPSVALSTVHQGNVQMKALIFGDKPSGVVSSKPQYIALYNESNFKKGSSLGRVFGLTNTGIGEKRVLVGASGNTEFFYDDGGDNVQVRDLANANLTRGADDYRCEVIEGDQYHPISHGK